MHDGEMQKRRDSGKEGCWKCRMQDKMKQERRDARGGMQN